VKSQIKIRNEITNLKALSKGNSSDFWAKDAIFALEWVLSGEGNEK